MSDKKIIDMLKTLLDEIDYDIYKTYFVYEKDTGEWNDPQPLINIVKQYIK